MRKTFFWPTGNQAAVLTREDRAANQNRTGIYQERCSKVQRQEPVRAVESCSSSEIRRDWRGVAAAASSDEDSGCRGGPWRGRGGSVRPARRRTGEGAGWRRSNDEEAWNGAEHEPCVDRDTGRSCRREHRQEREKARRGRHKNWIGKSTSCACEKRT